MNSRWLLVVLAIVLASCSGQRCELAGKEMALTDEERSALNERVSFEGIGLRPEQYPRLRKIVYRKWSDREGVYLVQEPVRVSKETGILIYMHGQGKDEKQGMRLFPNLRALLAGKGWIYVSPRDYEFGGLVDALHARYGDHPIYLAGASAGGAMIYREARQRLRTYAGLFLIGPALHSDEPPENGEITVPTYLVFGDNDGKNTSGARHVAAALKAQGVRCLVRELPGGGHNAPYQPPDWWPEALQFMTGTDPAP